MYNHYFERRLNMRQAQVTFSDPLVYIIIYLIGWQGLQLEVCVTRCWIKHYLEKKQLPDGSLK